MSVHAQGSCLGNQDRRQGRDLQLHAVLLKIMQTMKQAGWQEMRTVKACDMKACARTRASHVQEMHTWTLIRCMTAGQAPKFMQIVEGSMSSM